MAKMVAATAGQLNHIGRAGENLATIVSFDVSDWKAPNDNFSGVFSLYVQQTGVGYYLQPIIQPNTPGKNNGDTVLWEVTNSNTATIGAGKCELVYSEVSSLEKPVVNGQWFNDAFYSLEFMAIPIFGYKDGKKFLSSNANSFYLYVDESLQKKFYIEGETFYEIEEEDDPHIYQSQVIKSVIYDIIVTTALDLEAAIEIPDPIQVWLEELRDLAETVSQGATSYYLSEQYAKGTRNGVAVEQGDEGYHDNSKWYRDQAESWATSAATDALSAQEYLTNLQNSQIGTVTTLYPIDNTHLANATVSVQNVNDRLTFNFGIPAGLPGISSSGSGGLVVTFTEDAQTGDLVPNKTFYEVKSAILAGTVVVGVFQEGSSDYTTYDGFTSALPFYEGLDTIRFIKRTFNSTGCIEETVYWQLEDGTESITVTTNTITFSGGSGGLVVTFTMNNAQEVTVDKTYSEILTAINNKQIVIGVLQGDTKAIYQLNVFSSILGYIDFQRTGIEDNNDSVEYYIERCTISNNNEATYSIHSYYLSKSQPVSGNITVWGE